MLFNRDPHDLQKWFESLRCSNAQSYWALFEFKGVAGSQKSLALFRALAQHLCYTKDVFDLAPNLESDQNLHNLVNKVFTNYLNFVQEYELHLDFLIIHTNQFQLGFFLKYELY